MIAHCHEKKEKGTKAGCVQDQRGFFFNKRLTPFYRDPLTNPFFVG